MQTQQLYVAADTSVGQLRDVSGTKTMTPPELIFGVDTMLAITFLQQAGRSDILDLTEAAKSVVSWQFLMAQDFREDTPILIATTGDDIYVKDNTIYIPIITRTAEAADWLGSSESKSGLYGELNGYDSEGNPIFYSLIKNFSLRQRIAANGTPEELAADYLTAEQVRALIASGVVLQYSENGSSWHEAQTDSDIYIRFRSASSSAALWSTAIRLPAGAGGGTSGGGSVDVQFCTVTAVDAAAKTVTVTAADGSIHALKYEGA